MQEEGAELKKELLSKKEAALEHLENFPSMHFTKKKRLRFSTEKTEGMAIQPLTIRLLGIRITKLSTTSAKTRNRYRILLAETLPIRDTETG